MFVLLLADLISADDSTSIAVFCDCAALHSQYRVGLPLFQKSGIVQINATAPRARNAVKQLSCSLPGNYRRCRRRNAITGEWESSLSAALIWLTRQGVLQAMSGGYIRGPTDFQLWHDPERAYVVDALSLLQMLVCGPATKFLGRFDISRLNVELEAGTWLADGERVEDNDNADVFEASFSKMMDDIATPKPRRRRQTKSDVRHLQVNLQKFLNLLSYFVIFLVGRRQSATKLLEAEGTKERGGVLFLLTFLVARLIICQHVMRRCR